MNVLYKEIETIKEFIEAIRLRVDVFIIEQKCPPGWEPDEFDKESKHYVAIVEEKIVATARLREELGGIVKIERMVVKKNMRKKGIGLGLIKFLIDQAKKQGYKKILTSAQTHAENIYKKAGFRIISEPYDLYDLGIPHIDMEYIVTMRQEEI